MSCSPQRGLTDVVTLKSSGGFRIRVIVDLVKTVPFGAICTSHYLLKLNYYISGFFINDFSC